MYLRCTFEGTAMEESNSPRRSQVHLREKKLKDGAISLYLDYYPPVPHPDPKKAGRLTRREFLAIHILPDDSDTVRLEKWQRAKKIEIQRQRAYGTSPTKTDRSLNELRERTTLPEFMRGHVATAPELQPSTKEIWRQAARVFEGFMKARRYQLATAGLKNIDSALIDDFRTYLLTEAKDRRSLKVQGMSAERAEARAPILARTTASLYMRTVLSALREAYRRKYITERVFDGVAAIEMDGKKTREHLTPDELDDLMNTPPPFDNDELYRACLFSVFTGLRWSDIEEITFGDVDVREDGVWIAKRIVKKGKKDPAKVLIPADDQAIPYMIPKVRKVRKVDGKPAPDGDSSLRETLQDLAKSYPDDRIFAPLRYTTDLNDKIRSWVALAGIRKHITFHSFRHTFAGLHIDGGTDIYAVSKLMTHSSVKVTETVYASILDGRLRRAANKLPKRGKDGSE